MTRDRQTHHLRGSQRPPTALDDPDREVSIQAERAIERIRGAIAEKI